MMTTIEQCLEAQSILEEVAETARAERDRLLLLKPPKSSLYNIQSWNDAIEEYECRLSLIPQAIKHRRELLDSSLSIDRRENVLSMIKKEPGDLFNISYRIKFRD